MKSSYAFRAIGRVTSVVALSTLSFAFLAAGGLAGSAQAQEAKSVVVERAPADSAMRSWITVHVHPAAAEVPAGAQVQPLQTPSGTSAETYQPLPVIVGLPDLPLIGNRVAQAADTWGSTFNYQGAYVRELVLDHTGTQLSVRPAARALKAGERFKIRITPTFDSVAQIDLVVGDTWYGRRLGQVYPRPGLSVQMKAGKTVDLPLGANEYFTMNRAANERLVVAVRHPQAVGAARSDQPAYRLDDANGSVYLQLVPPGSYPAFEQLIAQAQ